MRHEITFSYFDEGTQVYQEVTLPGNAPSSVLRTACDRFIAALPRPAPPRVDLGFKVGGTSVEDEEQAR